MVVNKRQSSKPAKAKLISDSPKKNLEEAENVKSKPRKPNGYILWSIQERKNIAKYEAFSGRDIVRILGSRWVKLPDEEKLKWNTMAKEDPKPIEEKIERKERKQIKVKAAKREPSRFKNKKGKRK